MLREVPREVFDEWKGRLPEPFRKRAEHFFSEMERVRLGSEYWKAGDLEQYGRLIFESGESSVNNYECGCPELIRLYGILRETPGIYGGRFSGAGFKGCCMALVDPGRAEEILAAVEDQYLASFPELRGKYQGALCASDDGVSLAGGDGR